MMNYDVYHFLYISPFRLQIEMNYEKFQFVHVQQLNYEIIQTVQVIPHFHLPITSIWFNLLNRLIAEEQTS